MGLLVYTPMNALANSLVCAVKNAFMDTLSKILVNMFVFVDTLEVAHESTLEATLAEKLAGNDVITLPQFFFA